MYEVQSQSTYTLPMGYNDDQIVLLARDPHWLFAYWEISEDRKNHFIGAFGHELWEKSVPVLKVTNVSKNSSFYVRINDFSNSWYINVPDSNCLYVAELGRRIADEFFVNLVSSNYVEAPNDTISANTAAYFINYKDLNKGHLAPETGMIYETQSIKSVTRGVIGISSPELFGFAREESMFGVSSAELFGINIVAEHIGISSEYLIR